MRYICKVQPNDERADELEQMEAIYGKLSDITKEINGDTERSLGFIQEECQPYEQRYVEKNAPNTITYTS